MSEELAFTFKSKKSKKLSPKLILPENDAASTVIVEEDVKSLASESESSEHSYEKYAQAYDDFSRELAASESKSVDFAEDFEDVETVEEKRKAPKVLSKIQKPIVQSGNDGLEYKLAQLQLRLEKVESENKAKTLESAMNMVIANVDNLTTPQKKTLLHAIISTMK
nr:NSP5 protein [Rotavirus J]